ncbi:MAG: hypothetical protein IJF54_07505 [Clostridia bacterium]|nr:hypothetical protein [Clostridia bacterium]
MKKVRKYYIFTFLATLLCCTYPIYMGFRVIYDMTVLGSVPEKNFPKYIIPYTPIAIAVIIAVAVMPLLLKYVKKFAFLISSASSLVVFFITEWLFESKVIVTSTVVTTLESWQMVMCYVPPENFSTRKWKAVDVLIGEYSPTFKLHFYLISVVLILAIISCLYGFGKMIATEDFRKSKALTIQSVCTALFLGLCILACFTAFFRDGELTVSPISAFLMCLFFVVLGVTVGTYTGSFLLEKKKLFSIIIPMLAACVTTLAMYIGEMFLLSGHLYRFGEGLFFNGITGIVLAPIDILVILLSGCFTAFICKWLNGQKTEVRK